MICQCRFIIYNKYNLMKDADCGVRESRISCSEKDGKVLHLPLILCGSDTFLKVLVININKNKNLSHVLCCRQRLLLHLPAAQMQIITEKLY